MIKLTKETALDFFAELYRGKHHLPSELRDDGNGVFSVSHFGGFSTFDDDGLTRLVLAAHERCARAWITSGGPRRLRIWIQARDGRSADISRTHAQIEEAVAKFREEDDAPWWKVLARRAKEGGAA